MNKRAEQENMWYVIISLVITLLMILGILQIWNNSLCQSEKSQIETLTQQRDAWKDYATSLNDSINNCSNLIKEQRDICNDRINQSVTDCYTNLTLSLNYITITKIFFIVYHILIIVVYIPLSVNLFKIVVKVKLKKKWEELIKNYQKAWLIVKITLWIMFTIIFISYIMNFLTSKPF